MRPLERYGHLLLSGEWHVHTSYTDGKGTVEQYCQRAEDLGLPLIAFTEHVRRKLSYDFWHLLEEIEEARSAHDLIILSGCEAKVLPGGDLDVEDDILREVDYPIMAFHSFPPNLDLYLESLKAAIKSRKATTWAHPGLFLEKTGLKLSSEDLPEIFELLRDHEMGLEMNRKHSLPPPEWLDLAKSLKVKLVRGSDAHSFLDLTP